MGDPIAYQHLFWFTFHPEVYVFLIPAVGMIYEIIPKFSRKPIFSCLWGNGIHFYLRSSLLHRGHTICCNWHGFYHKDGIHDRHISSSSASAMHIFNWIATMWGGRIRFRAPIAFVVGGIILFFLAGAGGIVNSAMPLDFLTHDSLLGCRPYAPISDGTDNTCVYRVHILPVANDNRQDVQWKSSHGAVLAIVYRNITDIHHCTLLGLYGMPRRVADYVPVEPLIIMNQISTVGAYIMLHQWEYSLSTWSGCRMGQTCKDGPIRNWREILWLQATWASSLQRAEQQTWVLMILTGTTKSYNLNIA